MLEVRIENNSINFKVSSGITALLEPIDEKYSKTKSKLNLESILNYEILDSKINFYDKYYLWVNISD